MQFDHEKMNVYRLAIQFQLQVAQLTERLPKGKGYLTDQLNRAALSICLNIAEGAGEFSKKDKARFYRISKRSATECAAVIDVCDNLKLADVSLLMDCRKSLISIVSMLIKLVKAMA